MTIAEMRAILGLGPEVSDAAVVQAWAEYIGAGAAELEDEPATPDPHTAALDALFHAPGSAAALYTPPGEPQLDDPIRVIRSQPDQDVTFGGSRTVQGTNVFEIRVSDVAKPAKDGLLQLGSTDFRLLGDAMLDVEGLTHAIGAEELA